ncbi:hypothetical protein SDC9_198811 [bioreactor metagenome]|uniref:Uncharacterized protein n=1 Tax=bioreactor metagenome TaxID=1076179 RepID=A0A645IL24_9ZZZZ
MVLQPLRADMRFVALDIGAKIGYGDKAVILPRYGGGGIRHIFLPCRQSQNEDTEAYEENQGFVYETNNLSPVFIRAVYFVTVQ